MKAAAVSFYDVTTSFDIDVKSADAEYTFGDFDDFDEDFESSLGISG